jgi:homoprotocatechuate degradation regulator HpaR
MAPIRPLLREANLTEQQWRVLRVLVDEGDTDTSTLAQYGLLYAPSVTRILKELADRNLLERRADTADGRRFIIRATAQGRALVEATARKTGPVLDAYAAQFGHERLQALQRELAELARMIGPTSGGADKGPPD